MQFDEKSFPLEAQLSDFGPGKRVDLREVLEDDHPEVGHRQVEGHALVVLEIKIPKLLTRSVSRFGIIFPRTLAECIFIP